MRYVEEAGITEKALLKWDEAGDTSIWIKTVTGREELQRDQLFARTMIERDVDGQMVREIYDWPADLKVTECWLTFHDANVMKRIKVEQKSTKKTKGEAVDTESNEPQYEVVRLFHEGMSTAEFRKAFLGLHPDLIAEWWTAVREVNPRWGSAGAEVQAKN